MKRSTTLLLALVLPLSVSAQSDDPGSGGFRFKLRARPQALHSRAAHQAKARTKLEQSAPKDAPLSEARVRAAVREELAQRLTLEEWYGGLTSDSRKWFRSFIDRNRPGGHDFQRFFQANAKKTIAAVRDAAPARSAFVPPARAERAPFDLAPGDAGAPHPAPLAVSAKPYASIPGSKLVAHRVHGGTDRYHLTTISQSVHLRGVPANPATGCTSPTVFTSYPNYCNAYCDSCCGPAAAQSLLAWYGTPVRWANGSLANSTVDIQHRLANLMETEDGIDYTDPDDLGRVLGRAEFRQGKGYCLMEGGGTRLHLHHLLARGSPVILLEASGDWSHYLTVYGYDVERDRYDLANSEDLSWETLEHRWSFDAAEDDTAFGLWLAGAKGHSLWAYTDSTCEPTWDWTVQLILTSFSTASFVEAAFDTFTDLHVTPVSDPLHLNFYHLLSARISTAPFGVAPVALVETGGEALELAPGHTHVVVGHSPAHLTNLSVGQTVTVTADVDRVFVEKYPEVRCSFRVLKVNGSSVVESDVPCGQGTLSSNVYRLQLARAFKPEDRRIDFLVHGGLRSVSWPLAGCLRDRDLDGVCDEVDSNDDNDLVADASDNCPLVPNDDQADADGNGIGTACDSCEKCLANLSTGSVAPITWPFSRKCSCASACSYTFCRARDQLAGGPLDDDYLKWVELAHSKWWQDLMTPKLPPAPVPPGPHPPLPVEGLHGAARDLATVMHLGGDPKSQPRLLIEELGRVRKQPASTP